MEEKKIIIKEVESNCKISGEGRPLLILHGWGLGSSNSWRIIQKMLSSQEFKLIIPDFPGFGKSAKPPYPWSVSDYVDWLKELLNHLNIKNPCIIAHSFGGRVAIKLIAEDGVGVEKLILCAPAGVKPRETVDAKLTFWASRIGNIIFDAKHLNRFRDKVRKIFYLFLRNKDYVKAEGVMKDTIKKVLAEDLTPYLSEIKIKTLLVWGGKDKIVPLKYADIFKEEIKNSELKIIPKSAHSPHLDNPEKLLEAIIPFLR